MPPFSTLAQYPYPASMWNIYQRYASSQLPSLEHFVQLCVALMQLILRLPPVAADANRVVAVLRQFRFSVALPDPEVVGIPGVECTPRFV